MKHKHQQKYLKESNSTLRSPKLSLQNEKPTLGAPLPGVPAEWFYKKHQFFAKTGILHPHFQTKM